MYVPSGLGVIRTTRPVGQVVDTTTTFSRGGTGLDPIVRTGGIPVDDGRTVAGFDSPVVTVSSSAGLTMSAPPPGYQPPPLNNQIGLPPVVTNDSNAPNCPWYQSWNGSACAVNPVDLGLKVFALPSIAAQKLGFLGSDDMGIGSLVVSASVWAGALWYFTRKRGRR